MILRLSVTLVYKINNAKSDALSFADGQGIFNKQFTSLMLMTNYLIGIKSNSLGKNAKHNSMSLIDGSNSMLFLGMINGGNTTLLLADVGGLIDGIDTTLLLSAG